MRYVTLNSGMEMPLLGFGVPDGAAASASGPVLLPVSVQDVLAEQEAETGGLQP